MDSSTPVVKATRKTTLPDGTSIPVVKATRKTILPEGTTRKIEQREKDENKHESNADNAPQQTTELLSAANNDSRKCSTSRETTGEKSANAIKSPMTPVAQTVQGFNSSGDATPTHPEASLSEKQLISSALLKRTILPHGWICCREPAQVIEIGRQKILMDDANVYVDNDISDKTFQEEFAKLSCMPSCTCWFSKVRPTIGRRVTVIRRDEIMAVSSESAWELKIQICGCKEDQCRRIFTCFGLCLFWPLLIPCCIMMPKCYKDKNDLAATMYISARRISRDFRAVVPVDRIGDVAEVMMAPSPVRVQMMTR